MKPFPSSLLHLRGSANFLPWLLAFFLLCLVSTAQAAPVVATILGVKGNNQVRHNGKFSNLARNDSLYVGDLVRIASGGKATLLFSDGSQVRLNSGAVVQITPPTPIAGGKRSLFRVVGGEIWARLQPNKGVQTASAILGVAGTEFDVQVTETRTTLTVIEGVVEFSNSLGAVAVGASQQSTATPTTAPTAPVTLPNADFIVEWTLDLNDAIIPREKLFIDLDGPQLRAQLAQRSQRAMQNPNDATVQRDWGEALFDAKRFPEAATHFERANELQPNQSPTLTRLGYVRLELGQTNEAQTAFQGAIESAVNNGEKAAALSGLASLQLATGQLADAESKARVALELTPQSAEAGNTLGLTLSRQAGRETEAKAAFENALQAEPQNLRYQAQSWLALLLLSQNDRAGALKFAQEAVKAAPRSGLAHGNLALIYFFDNQPSRAVEEARLATSLNPQSVAARVALGQALLAQGDIDGAAQAAAQAVALDPKLSAAHYLLGAADAQRRDYTHAERSLKESLRLTPQFLPAASALARVYIRMGRPQEGRALLTRLQETQSNNASVAAALGEVLYEEALYPEAVAQYERAVAIQPTSALAYAGLARVALDANRLNQAILAGQKAVQLAPEVGAYHAILGLAYTYSRLDVQAEREYRTALALDPQNALALVQLALVNQDGDARTTKRTAGLAFAQGFLLDPAISRQLLRGGVKNEVTPSAGPKNDGLLYTARDIGRDGDFHFYGRANRFSDDGDRNNSFFKELNGRQDSTLNIGSRTNLYLHFFHRRDKAGLPGQATSPVEDDRNQFQLNQGIIAARYRVNARGHLFAGFFANSQNNELTNPNRDLSSVLPGVTALGVPIRITQSGQRSAARDPELRYDWRLSEDPARPRILSFGAARLHTNDKLARDLLIPGLFGTPDNVGILRQQFSARTTLAYAQLSEKRNEKLNYSFQLRAQRVKNTANSALQNISGRTLTFLQFPVVVPPSKTYLLPSATLNFQADRRTSIRLFASRRFTDTTSSILTPAETLLSTEGQIVPAGLPERSRIVEADLERQLPNNGLLKLFLFHTEARNVRFDASSYFNSNDLDLNNSILLNSVLLDRVRRVGVGTRLEKQLGRSLFGQVGVVLNRTRSEAGSGDNQTAPYQPRFVATSSLNYIDAKGYKASVSLNYASSFYEDTNLTPVRTRDKFPAKTTVDLRLAREPRVHQELFIQVLNLFNARQIAFRDIPVGRRRFQLGVAQRF